SQIAVMFGNGDGTLGPPSPLTTMSGPVAVMTGDFNGDGNQDIAAAISNCIDVTCIPVPGGVAILFGNGDGSFQNQLYYATGRVLAHANVGSGQYIQALSLADFDHDGTLDFAVANQGDNTVTVLVQSPVLAFFPSTLSFASTAVGSSSTPLSFSVT